MNDAKQKINQLKQLIRTWDYEYYVLDSPTVEDAEYDAKMRELKALESEHPDLVTADSPTAASRERLCGNSRPSVTAFPC